MTPAMGALQRDYLPADLKLEMDAAGVSRAVSVQARQSLAETQCLLDFAATREFLAAVVGWVPLRDANVGEHLDRFAAHAKMKGVRHVLQDEPDDDYMLHDDFQRGIAALLSYRLVYDIVIFERHLPQAIRLVDAHPEQVFVLDHIAKPRIKDGLLSPWREHLGELARRPNVYCKVSGMATEADWSGWRGEDLRPYFEVALECFTPRRLMFGSDWPVLRLAGEYGQWAGLVKQWIAELSPDEQSRILEGTACEAYRL